MHPVLSQISRAVASNSQLLAKAELYFTAFLSMSDMASDIVMVVSLSSGAWGDDLLWEPYSRGDAARMLTTLLCSRFFSHRPDIIEITRCHTPWPR